VKEGVEMNGYIKSAVCHNVSGFIRYCREGRKHDRLDYITEYSTAPLEFWSELVNENRIRHKENKLNKNKKAVEGRQLMVKLDKDSTISAEEFAKYLKRKLGVEVYVFEHWDGKNRHFHIILADRIKLKEPIPAKLSKRARFYNAEGKEVKKADAVKVVPKGTVLQAEQKFSEKIDEFRTRKWLEEFKTELFDYLQMTKFDIDKEFAFETIGTKKVKSEEPEDKKDVMAARERNKFRAELNAYLADENTPSKKEFCDYCNISPRMKYIPNSIIDDIRDKFAEFEKLYPVYQKTAENGFKSLTEPNTITVSDEETSIIYLDELSEEELRDEYINAKIDLYQAEQDNDTSLIQQLKDFISDIISALKEMFGYNDIGIAMLDEKVEQELGLDDIDY
jgi:hypothetical protein